MAVPALPRGVVGDWGTLARESRAVIGRPGRFQRPPATLAGAVCPPPDRLNDGSQGRNHGGRMIVWSHPLFRRVTPSSPLFNPPDPPPLLYHIPPPRQASSITCDLSLSTPLYLSLSLPSPTNTPSQRLSQLSPHSISSF